MQLFLPNNHSKWHIEYRSVTAELFSLLEKAILKHYSNQADLVESIKQVAEAEVNSNNFKIATSKNGIQTSFLLRRYPEYRVIDSVLGVYSVIRFLNQNGLKTPEIIQADSGKDLVFMNGNYFTLFKFVEADHFRGTLEEIESVGEELGKMDALLFDYPDESSIKEMVAFPEKFVALREFSVSTWEDIFDEAEKHYRNTKDDFDGELLAHKNFILDAVNKTPQGGFTALPHQILHFDLHPHNLLTDGKELLAILDFDSLRYLERIRGVAFAMHRLVRQHVVLSNPNNIMHAVKNAQKIFLKAYQQSNTLTPEELHAAAYFLRHEALSRLSYSMKDFYYNGNGAWKGDLEKQTATIAEASYFE